MNEFTFYQPTKIIFGKGRVNELKNYIPDHVRRIIIVTDKNLIKNNLLVKDIIKDIENDFQTDVFFEIEENPSFETVKKGAALAKLKASELVIGLGGGSPMDVAKGIAVIAANKGSIKEYVGGKKLKKTPLPIICIPTTSGTGSEVTPFAVFTDKKDQNKCGFFHEGIFPFLSIIDPELSFSMPVKVIINTGLDVLSHAIEAYFSDLSFYHNDMYALKAIQLAFKNLVHATQRNEEAMQNMSYASMLAGIAISHSSTILPHIMGYPLTVFHEIPHGLASFLTIPTYLEFLKRNKFEKKRIEKFENLIGGMEQIPIFADQLNLSLKLRDYGVNESSFDIFASKTIKKGDIQISPGDITKNNIIEIYKDSF